jgi:hypothetical protein
MAVTDYSSYFGPAPDPYGIYGPYKPTVPAVPGVDYPPSPKTDSGGGASWWSQNKQTVTSGLAGFGAGYSAISARNQAQGQKNVLGYEAQAAANQAAIAGYQAEIAQQVGATNEQSSRLQTAAQFGSERAHMAASGIDLGQGSATDVLASTEYMGERNAMMIRDDTNRQVWQLHNQQTAYQAAQQAKLAQMNAINPDMAAFGSLLGSATSFAASYK